MIYEYALDPALVARWHDRREYLFFDEKFGITTRRIVSIYPKKTKWQRMIWEAFQFGDHASDESAKLRLGALIGKLTEEAVKRRSTFSEIPSWIERTEREHGERPFRAILTGLAGRTNPAVIEASKLVQHGHERWDVPEMPTVLRRASEMADFIAPVLRVCRHAIFVDPHFDPNIIRFRKPFEAMIEKMCEHRDASEEITIELHTGIERFFRKYDPRTDEINEQKYHEVMGSCRENLPRMIPSGVKVKLVIWKEREHGQELHNRFVLTELAGILLATGLDENPDPDSESMDTVILLPKEQRNRCSQQYDGTSPAFDYAGDPVEIIGRKAP